MSPGFGMEPTAVTLAQLLSMAALIAATIEYCEIVRRRVATRALQAQRLETEEVGLRGLVRVLLTDPEP